MVVKIIGKYIFLIYWNIKNDKILMNYYNRIIFDLGF